MSPREPVLRRAVRVIVLAPGDSTLLLECRNPRSGRSWWITPGGGVDPGESHEDAARRELREELGWNFDGPLGPCVWTREHVFEWRDDYWRQEERFHVVRARAEFVPSPTIDAAQIAREGLGASRWWHPADLVAARDESFAPARFPDLLAALLRDGPPPAPIDVGA
jgi:8-oxo-dGTP pyrophosphatase MutT (NUDIX family)